MIANRILYTSKHLPLFTVQSKAGCVTAGKMFLVSVSLECLKIRMCHIKVAQIPKKIYITTNKYEKSTVFFLFLFRSGSEFIWNVWQVERLVDAVLHDGFRSWAASSSGAAAGRQQSCAQRPGICLQGLLGDEDGAGSGSGSGSGPGCSSWKSACLCSGVGLQSQDCWRPSSVLHFLLGIVPGFPLEEAHLEPQKAVIFFLAEAIELGQVTICISVCYTVKYLLLVLIKSVSR